MSQARRKAVLDIASASLDAGSGVVPAKRADLSALYGRDVLDLSSLRALLPQDVYKKLEGAVSAGTQLPAEISDVIANAMKDWAIGRGATHYTHWFQPMTGLTAEKHDAFMAPGPDGRVFNEFSGKNLICGEPDASSFPSGGIRSTFEARGYTAWDPTSPVFIVDGPGGSTLHIPTVFYSYTGEALDRKTPLLRSLAALSRQALRILRLFGDTASTSVQAVVGAEQEYFLVDRRLAALRPDLMLSGRTLMGAVSPKGQELEDHYFGAIPSRVMSFMQDVEYRLCVLGIPCRTRHNEVAPGQFEMAPQYEEANIAVDHNMLIMNILRHTAPRHGFVCLLHEKPFAGVNGSGKHVNWSLRDSGGNNLLSPGATPHTNAQFLVFLAAVLRAVHRHSTVLRLGIVGAGNDLRIGANEAPPAILSVYLGEQLTEVLNSLAEGSFGKSARQKKGLEIGVSTLPPLPKDYSDRNRTSPFAFTGDKFEFRAVGASQSIAPACIAVNTALACALDDIATSLEAGVCEGAPLNQAVQELLISLSREHMPIVFNGNGYAREWKEEAARRGLPNMASTVETVEHYSDPMVMDVFMRHAVLTERELLARQEILLDAYAKTIAVESGLIGRIGRTSILPVAMDAQSRAAELALRVRDLLGPGSAGKSGKEGAGRGGEICPEEKNFCVMRERTQDLAASLETLDAARRKLYDSPETLTRALAARDIVLPAMQDCRKRIDALEILLNDADWPLPTYAELLWTH
ncbi:MAG: glutamine synthetase III [Desulfovibrio sp.]|jgi:glutamine synthetase|nr:glutamine synthetase III [Desulfovibrio sp.]